ncbi:MAG: PAS domain S-box protein [Candidatus Polarisedimenticolaceae bacterium]|nr:PAS domain S-box protein [Candidatus Polarisedimenticolaceae bacterium]
MTSLITKKRLIIFSLVAAIMLALGSWVIQCKIESDSQIEIGRYLRAELNMTHQAVYSWVKVHHAATVVWANTLEMRQFTQRLLAYGNSRDSLLGTDVQADVSEWLAPVVASNEYQGFFIVDPDNITLSSSDTQSIGLPSTLINQPGFLKQAWAGVNSVSLPRRSNQLLPDEHGNLKVGRATMFVAAPIRDEKDEVMAILVFRIDPMVGFSTIFMRGWRGATGEVYAFDDAGMLISESRFNYRLRELGIVRFDQEAMLNITLQNHAGGNKEGIAPLTFMAQQATSGQSGMNLEGYANYYNADVVGVWLWDARLGFGFAAEIEKAEAFQTIYSNRFAITSATLFSIIFFLVLMAVFIRNRGQILEREICQRTVLETVAEGIITLAPDGIIETANPAVESIFGYQASELIGESINMLMPSHQHEAHVGYLAGSSQAGEESEVSIINMPREVVGMHKNGSSFPLDITVCEMNINDQRKYNCTLRDITERKQAELALRESEKQFRNILESSPIPMMITNMSGTIELFNHKFVDLFGWTIDDVHTIDQWREAVYPDETYRNDVIEAWESIVEKAKVSGLEIPPQEWMLTCKNGDIRMVELRMMPAGSERNVIVMSDITERIRAEAVLIDARKQAELATKAKSEFLAVMSHEIRTPMNGVLGMAQLLRKSPLNDEQQGQVDILYQSGKSLMNIINDVLDFSKIEAGKLELEASDFDLEQELSYICHLLSPKAEEKGLELILNYSHECPRFIVADAGRMRQIMLNLIGNAIKFTEAGHVVVRVRKEGGSDDWIDLRLEVQDTGIGIDLGERIGEGDTANLFNSFSQADASTTRRFGGTGLGLAISKQLVELMGGEIGVNSAPGLGSTFWLTINVPLSAPKDLLNKLPLLDIPVLLISQSLENSTVLSSQLKKLAMQVEVAEGAEEGEGKLRRAAEVGEPFIVAILDCDSLKIGCEAFARSIKEDKFLERTVFVLLGKKRPQKDGQHTEESDCFSCHPKPSSIDVMQYVLVDALGARSELPLQPTLLSRTEIPENVRLLLVEDNLVNQKVVGAILKRLNFEFDVASNGVEALSRYEGVNYDLILMDCLMPTMDGYLTTKKIREMEQGQSRHVPIIALTADAQQSNEKRCFDSGMDDYLSKPFNVSELRNKLLRWLGDAESVTDSSDEQGQTAIDEATTSDLRKALGDDFVEVIDAFLESMPTIFSDMERAKQPYDAEAMYRHAHSMKSCSANVGAVHLSALAIQFEQEIDSSTIVDFDGKFTQFQQAFESAKTELIAQYKS